MQLSTIIRRNFVGPDFLIDEPRFETSAHTLRWLRTSRLVSIITRRRIRPGCQVEFEQALQTFLVFADSFPGHIDLHLLSRLQGRRRDCVVVNRFADASVRQVFTSSRSYFIWLTQLQTFTEEMPEVDTISCGRGRAYGTSRRKSGGLSFRMRVSKAVGFGVVLGVMWMLPLLPFGVLLGWQPFLRDMILIAFVLSATAAVIVSFWDDRCMADFPNDPGKRS